MQVDRNEDPTEVAERRTKALALSQMEEISRQPSETQKTSKRTNFGMKEDGNPMFSLSVDLFRSV